MYEFAVHTRLNESENEDSAVFVTLFGKQMETQKFLLQFPDNTIVPLQTNQIDLFYFVDQDIGAVRESHESNERNRILLLAEINQILT